MGSPLSKDEPRVKANPSTDLPVSASTTVPRTFNQLSPAGAEAPSAPPRGSPAPCALSWFSGGLAAAAADLYAPLQ
jgi:hypothetical protein